eukprot:scaffold77509_cov75-Phaeocystis_antarctica.AAC.4
MSSGTSQRGCLLPGCAEAAAGKGSERWCTAPGRSLRPPVRAVHQEHPSQMCRSQRPTGCSVPRQASERG